MTIKKSGRLRDSYRSLILRSTQSKGLFKNMINIKYIITPVLTDRSPLWMRQVVEPSIVSLFFGETELFF